ncbi:MAG: methyltransferase domain-containing protein [Thermosynechococcaceae cyanobacterium MS004]|nr:methyltransferase domain-containing protein [Thermosynechococcaceae cyanobacterium MS004]
MPLLPEHRSKIDDENDLLFYSVPRIVTHVDAGFIETLTQLYRDHLQPQTRILDLMSSWVSHLPPELEFEHVEGHGMNAEELAKNPRLDHYFVQNLNQNPTLPLPDQSFDGVLNTVSVQYLQYPEAVFSEIHRVLKPGGIAIISFSNRMFFEKAIQVWRDSSEELRVKLVEHYFSAIAGFTPPESIYKQPEKRSLLSFWNASPGDPFYAVIAQRV